MTGIYQFSKKIIFYCFFSLACRRQTLWAFAEEVKEWFLRASKAWKLKTSNSFLRLNAKQGCWNTRSNCSLHCSTLLWNVSNHILYSMILNLIFLVEESIQRRWQLVESRESIVTLKLVNIYSTAHFETWSTFVPSIFFVFHSNMWTQKFISWELQNSRVSLFSSAWKIFFSCCWKKHKTSTKNSRVRQSQVSMWPEASRIGSSHEKYYAVQLI